MIELTFSIPLGAFYFALFMAGLLIGALGARWVYRPTPGRVRVPYPDPTSLRSKWPVPDLRPTQPPPRAP